MFTWAAAIQVNFAEACLSIADIRDFNGKPDQTAHPTSGTRQHPDEMVGPTLFLASDAASYVTGTIIYADGGWLAQDGRFTPPGM